MKSNGEKTNDQLSSAGRWQRRFTKISKIVQLSYVQEEKSWAANIGIPVYLILGSCR